MLTQDVLRIRCRLWIRKGTTIAKRLSRSAQLARLMRLQSPKRSLQGRRLRKGTELRNGQSWKRVRREETKRSKTEEKIEGKRGEKEADKRHQAHQVCSVGISNETMGSLVNAMNGLICGLPHASRRCVREQLVIRVLDLVLQKHWQHNCPRPCQSVRCPCSFAQHQHTWISSYTWGPPCAEAMIQFLKLLTADDYDFGKFGPLSSPRIRETELEPLLPSCSTRMPLLLD